MNMVETLQAHPIFKDFSAQDLALLSSALVERNFSAGERIIKEDEIGLSLFILESGLAEVIKTTLTGDRPMISTIEPGSIFGEIALVGDHHRTAEVIAKKDCRVFELNYLTLDQLIMQHPLIGSKVFHLIAKSLSEKIKHTTADLLSVVQNARMAAMGEMAASIVHEINNPLTVIQSYSERIHKECQAETLNRENILKSSDRVNAMVGRITQIIKSVKSLAREASQDPMEPTSLEEIINQTLELSKARVRDENIKLEIHIPSPDIKWNCRGVQISQVLLNLLNNAIFAVHGLNQAWIRIEAKQLENSLELSISDSGAGVPAENREQIFRSFFTTKSLHQGTGIGLSIAAKIVEGHGGKISLDTQSPHTRFVVLLPKTT